LKSAIQKQLLYFKEDIRFRLSACDVTFPAVAAVSLCNKKYSRGVNCQALIPLKITTCKQTLRA